VSTGTRKELGRGPLRADQLPDGSPYELSDGHPILCAPTGARGSKGNLLGAEVLETDPAVTAAGVDTGFSPEPGLLRAPDVAVGDIPDAPGWVRGVPRLALEYADTGQDEGELADRIRDLLSRGTELIWVVRMIGPRRVEVHQQGKTPRTIEDGKLLEAPGILRNAVPVSALYDRTSAHQAVLRNLLQRQGYESLDEVRAEGKAEGKALAIIAVLGSRGLVLPAAQHARILATTDEATLDRWLGRAAQVATPEDLG
jgi:hypothetical protein